MTPTTLDRIGRILGADGVARLGQRADGLEPTTDERQAEP
jgi:hypothetical protein